MFTTGITDLDGNPGKESLTAEWSQAIGGKAMLTIEITPKDAGEVSPVSGEMNYGIVTIKAVASDGYSFIGWSEDGKILSKSAILNYILYKLIFISIVFGLHGYN